MAGETLHPLLDCIVNMLYLLKKKKSPATAPLSPDSAPISPYSAPPSAPPIYPSSPDIV